MVLSELHASFPQVGRATNQSANFKLWFEEVQKHTGAEDICSLVSSALTVADFITEKPWLHSVPNLGKRICETAFCTWSLSRQSPLLSPDLTTAWNPVPDSHFQVYLPQLYFPLRFTLQTLSLAPPLNPQCWALHGLVAPVVISWIPRTMLDLSALPADSDIFSKGASLFCPPSPLKFNIKLQSFPFCPCPLNMNEF